MAASGANVLRYTALGSGVFYGLYHQRTLNAHAEQQSVQRRYRTEESLIAQAKAAYARKEMPGGEKGQGGGVISDPDDPKFDLEAYLTMKMGNEAK
ncbi:hypothetical protein MMC34_007917 [Xylographa carneopallida]|nr:hypothetical protein [Xylographa carneopallida]